MKEQKWIQGDIHTHTVFSDGLHTVEEAICIAKSVELEFIVLSDHNTFLQNEYIHQHNVSKRGWIETNSLNNKEVVLVQGVELTTSKGHCNLIGSQKPFVVNEFTTLHEVQAALESGASKGAFISINHPMIGDRWEWGFDTVFYNAIEIWNGSTLSRNQEVIAWWQKQLSLGKKIIGTGGSDVHHHGMGNRFYGQGNTLVLVEEKTQEAIIKGLHKGHVCVASHPKASKVFFSIEGSLIGDTHELKVNEDISSLGFIELDIEFSMEDDGLLKIIGDQGVQEEIKIQKKLKHITYQVPVNSKFYRLEMWHIDENNELYQPFLTNPIYIKPSGGSNENESNY